MVVVVVVGSMVESPEVWLLSNASSAQVYSHRGESPLLAELAAQTTRLKLYIDFLTKIQSFSQHT